MPDAKHERWVHPDSIAAIIAFLASPDNKVTRGAVLPVYGGS
jgi:NAD(P)-dependent dehydrogenase (short-subunit alcohol dehydrogenase family)